MKQRILSKFQYFHNLKVVATLLVVAGFSLRFTLPVYSAEIAPYYSFGLAQGMSFQPGYQSFTVNLTNDIGLIVKPAEKHHVLGFYEIKYLGPGLRTQEGDRFTDRYMDHLYVLKHKWEFMESLIFQSQIDYMKEHRRSGANEAWGLGLYDYERTGGLVGVDKDFEKFKAGGNFQYHYLKFPNYTDLLTEISAGGTEAESSANKQNQYLYQLHGQLDYRENTFSLDFTWQNYEKQKVVVDAVQPDGSYYSGTLQKDFSTSISIERIQKIGGGILIIPGLKYTIKNSNQNYQHFTAAGDTVPAKYLPDYYSYSQTVLDLPITLALSKKWDFVFTPTFDIKSYSVRDIRNENGDFVTGTKQSNNLTLITISFNKKTTDVSTTSLFLTQQTQSSNMKYEKYTPYNYSGQFVGLQYTISY